MLLGTFTLLACCSAESQYAHIDFTSFYRLSTLDVTHVRKCTRLSRIPYCNQRKAGHGTGNEATITTSSYDMAWVHDDIIVMIVRCFMLPYPYPELQLWQHELKVLQCVMEARRSRGINWSTSIMLTNQLLMGNRKTPSCYKARIVCPYNRLSSAPAGEDARLHGWEHMVQ